MHPHDAKVFSRAQSLGRGGRAGDYELLSGQAYRGVLAQSRVAGGLYKVSSMVTTATTAGTRMNEAGRRLFHTPSSLPFRSGRTL